MAGTYSKISRITCSTTASTIRFAVLVERCEYARVTGTQRLLAQYSAIFLLCHVDDELPQHSGR